MKISCTALKNIEHIQISQRINLFHFEHMVPHTGKVVNMPKKEPPISFS